MSEALSAGHAARDDAELYAEIARVIEKMEELRERMRRDDAEIKKASQATRTKLSSIAKILAELKAA